MIRKSILLVAAASLVLGGLSAQVERISRDAKGRVGASVMILETGSRADFHGDEHFPMQSVYKVPISMAVLHLVDAGALRLEQKVRVESGDLVPSKAHSPIRDEHPQGGFEMSLRELIRYAISESDGTASDVLLRLAGGPERVMRYLREKVGVSGVIVADPERELAADDHAQYRNWATPNGAVALLRALYEGRGLSSDSRALLLQFMTESTPGARRIKGRLPAGTAVAHKTGTSNTANGMTPATNDIGVITLPDGRHLLVAVFVSDSRADQATREAVIARIARAAWDWANG